MTTRWHVRFFPYCLARVGIQGSICSDAQLRSSIPFSAFWLRSSVVSVLISLISDTRDIVPHDINLIFQRVLVHAAACCPDPRASPWSCTTSLAGAALPPLPRDPKQTLNWNCSHNIKQDNGNCILPHTWG